MTWLMTLQDRTRGLRLLRAVLPIDSRAGTQQKIDEEIFGDNAGTVETESRHIVRKIEVLGHWPRQRPWSCLVWRPSRRPYARCDRVSMRVGSSGMTRRTAAGPRAIAPPQLCAPPVW